MSWEVEFTDEFETWWNSLMEDEQIEDVIVTSKHANMRELRGKVVRSHHRAELRVLYAFDPRRTGILLIGGDKTGNPKWYEEYVPIADALFDDHLRQIEREEQELEGKKRGKELQ